MSEDTVQSIVDDNSVTELLTTTLETPAADTPLPLNESDTFPTPSDSGDVAANSSGTFGAESLVYSENPIFGTFVVVELVMTTLELIISIVAAIKMKRWRKNYRNQMLMQLTAARFIKRIIFTFKFLACRDKISNSEAVANFLYCSQLYIDFVIAVLVFFFIKHMYNSLIIVLVKISQNSFYKVMSYSWLIPIPITVVCSVVIVTGFLDRWYVNLFICCVFRWPLIFLGTAVYITIVYRVLSDKIRQFARSLAVVTFLLCLTINIYLFSKDIMELWCLTSLMTLLIGYISGFLMNVLILVLYIILLILTYQNKTQSSRSLPDYSLADANIKC